MPTTPAKTRKLLRDGKAKVLRRDPFTIRLNYATGEAKQEIYGYITKNTRIHNELPKEHRIDALCITLKSESKTIGSLVLHQKDKKAQPSNT